MKPSSPARWKLSAPRYGRRPEVSVARVLVVAGSDSGGGAGIQADIKTITMLGGYAATAVTAITVQNTLGVSAVHTVPPAIIAAQMDAILSDIGADAVKLGMLGDVATIDAVADVLAHVSIPIVLDPVMIAKGGASLLAEQAVETLVRRLLPLATLVTPNLPELSVLVGRDVRIEADMRPAGHRLLQLGAQAVLAKGGHLETEILTDWLLFAGGEQAFAGERIHTRHTHGTGCTLASAIATGIAQGMPLPEAVERARQFVRRAMAAAPRLGGGHGPLGHQAVRLPA